ncbi:MAG: pyridoxine 5'-phosphate synthase [Deltaproteobacteria bacterium]|nr:pyridoxine 5'-phosphate synthase [Kofleriaceae bacterium]
MALHLSVNLNKVALLRNSRGANNPSPRVAAHACIDAGAAGLTLHWRADERHTRQSDVRDLRAIAAERGVEFNLEGDERPELAALAHELRVDQFTLVPVTPGEVTSDHGWDLPRQAEAVRRILDPLNQRGVRTAIFMDPVPAHMERAAATGTQRVEIYTEPYAAAWHTPRRQAELDRMKACARALVGAGLGVNAGHDLNLENLPILAREVPELQEVSIGHALLADALYLGLRAAVEAYVRACRGDEMTPPVTQ